MSTFHVRRSHENLIGIKSEFATVKRYQHAIESTPIALRTSIRYTKDIRRDTARKKTRKVAIVDGMEIRRRRGVIDNVTSVFIML